MAASPIAPKPKTIGLPRIPRGEHGSRVPLSYAQQGLWFLAQREGVSNAYHLPFGLQLKGRLDLAVLRRALNRIVARHEALRTTFDCTQSEVVQKIGPPEGNHFRLVEHDLTHDSHIKERRQRLIEQESHAPFDLKAGPLIRGRLIREGVDQHTLLITMHHIVSDGWSIRIFLNELGKLYSAYLSDEVDSLPELPVQYSDYTAWQQQSIDSEMIRQHAQYWKTTLAGASTLLQLPTDYNRPLQHDFLGDYVEMELDGDLKADLKQLGKRHGATLYMTLLSGWAALLARLSGERDLTIGTPAANRGQAEIRDLIGLFANTLVVRLDLSGEITVAGLIARVRKQVLAAQQHQDIPFEEVVKLTAPVRSLSQNPLFQVMFAWENMSEGTLSFAGLEAETLESAAYRVAKFDLSLLLREKDDRIVGGLEYASSLFERSTVQRYAGHLKTLLKAMIAGDNRPISQLPLMTDAERQQIVHAWNATKIPYPNDRCTHELFEEQANQTPDAIAVMFEDKALSYGQLNQQANQLAHYLRDMGVMPDTRVAICVERGFEMTVAFMAVLKAGGAYVPLDPSYPLERLRFMIQDSASLVLLTQAHLQERFVDAGIGIPILDVTDASPWRDHPENDVAIDLAGLTPSHLAYVIYTSGSTGQPKGVQISHAALTNFLISMRDQPGIGPADVLLAVTTYTFDIAQLELLLPLTAGACVMIANRNTVVNGPLLAQELQRGVTLMQATPATWRMLLEAGWEGTDKLTALCGGEALSVDLANKIGSRAASTWNMYGPTETTIWSLSARIKEGAGHIPIGRPIANTRVYILDDCGQPVPIGVTGEIYIGGTGLARGYLNRPDLTAESFVEDPFSDKANARMYRTGDLGKWRADGNVEFLGRKGFQVKVRGFRIELEEIETRLREHAAVNEAVVTTREDATGSKLLVAYYTCRESSQRVARTMATLGVGELRRHLMASLPEYMVPVAYVRMERMPLTSNGKLDRKSLPEPGADAYSSRAYEAPQGETEHQLAHLWAEILQIDRVGRQDDFFELGGHSLLAVTLIERMRRIGLQVDVSSLFMAPTIAQLAGNIEQHVAAVEVPANGIPGSCTKITPHMLPLITLTDEEISRIVSTVPGGAANVQDIYPLAPLQEGILYHHMMSAEGDAYLLADEFSFTRREHLDEYLKALQAVVKRHDVLRTAVLWEGLHEPVQVVWRRAALAVEEIELEPANGDIGEQLFEHFNPRGFRIDVRHAPLLRLYAAYDREKERWLVLRLLHHLAGDQATLEAIHYEVKQHVLGEAEQLAAPLQFRNLVAQARLGGTQPKHEAFFRQMLGDVKEPTAPFGLVDVQGNGELEDARMVLDANLAWRMRANARRLRVSLAAICHLAWALVLGNVSGSDDVVFGTVLYGRMQGANDAGRALGLFINTLPVRIPLGAVGAEAGVRSTQSMLVSLMRHEHASLALAQRCSAVSAPAPLFSALLNYRHSLRARRRPSEPMQVWKGMQHVRAERRTNYPFNLSVDDSGEDFVLTAQTPVSIGPLRICDFMQTALTSLIDALETSPTTPVSELEVLPVSERERILYEWNGMPSGLEDEISTLPVAPNPDVIDRIA